MFCNVMGELIEPVPIDDVFVSGVGKIEHFHGLIRYWLFVEEGPARIVKCKIVIPISAARFMNATAKHALAKL